MDRFGGRHWLADLLARLQDHPARRIDELLPWNWKREREQKAAERADQTNPALSTTVSTALTGCVLFNFTSTGRSPR